jgi:hypothetical protein
MTDADSNPEPSSPSSSSAQTDPDAEADGGSDAEGRQRAVDALGTQEGWHAEEFAARVHYRGAEDRYSVEYYAPSDCVLYWKVRADGDVAVPVGRGTVPDPLRERVRQDLREAGVDPTVESRVV